MQNFRTDSLEASGKVSDQFLKLSLNLFLSNILSTFSEENVIQMQFHQHLKLSSASGNSS